MPIMHHICIQTNDYPASLAFYQKLGFTIFKTSQNFHGRAYNTWLQLADFYIELQTGKTPLTAGTDLNHTGLVHFGLMVSDLPSYVAQLALPDKCFRLKNKQVIYEVFGSRLCKVVAPEGTIIELRDSPIEVGD
ncbi:VOC family protein [Agrilactobacillus yilanensis]|uniref:VOC family protein n=1 Tax=Agrilactobacillus yilanensis TaxID=2485997 RepID=A0ABW4J604_9LACO|nr:VOC family protein [Agrilactobacillus yilanensis]